MVALYEPCPIADIFCSGLAKVENVGGGCLRFYLYTLQAPLNGEGEAERVLVAKIVAPASAVPDAILQMAAAIGGTLVKALPAVINVLQ